MKRQPPDLDSLIEEATLDCYSEEECRAGFATLLEDNLETLFKAKLKRCTVTVIKIGGSDDRVIKAIVRSGKATLPVDILDLDIARSIKGSEWIAAYRKWEKGG